MVARLVWDQDAAGSNPVTSTTYTKSANWLIMLVCGLFLCPHSGLISAFGVYLVFMHLKTAVFKWSQKYVIHDIKRYILCFDRIYRRKRTQNKSTGGQEAAGSSPVTRTILRDKL